MNIKVAAFTVSEKSNNTEIVLGKEYRNVYQSMVPLYYSNLYRLFQNITLSYEENVKIFDCLAGLLLSNGDFI